MTEEISIKPQKKRVNSKKKGSSFELSISKMLSTNLAPLNFKRTQQSGAITGGKNSRFNSNFSTEALSMFVGDICPINETDIIKSEGWAFKFALECKFYKDCDTLEHLFANTKIKNWFLQALSDAEKINKEPLLIFKFNHTEIFCATNDHTIDRLPISISKSMVLDFGDGYKINIFLFKEALQDQAWWKVFEHDKLNCYEKYDQLQEVKRDCKTCIDVKSCIGNN